MGRRDDGKGGLPHREGIRQEHRSGEVARRAICDGPILGSATQRRRVGADPISFWGTFRCKRPNSTLAASSGFDQPLMIVLASSRILELGARSWKDCRQFGRRTTVGSKRGCHHASGLPSRKNPPVGPLCGSVAAQTIPAAPSLAVRGAPAPPIAVATQPGHTAFTRIRAPLSSAASVRVKAFRAAFVT